MDAVLKKIPRDIAAAPHSAASKRPSQEEAEAAVRTLIAWTGDGADREGLLDALRLVANAYREFFKGYEESPLEPLSKTFDEVGGYDDVVKRRRIDFSS